MQKPPRHELYSAFVDFVRKENQKERSQVARQMRNVFLWCFLLPAAVSASLLYLIKIGAIPRSLKSELDWVILVFPVVYSIYFLGSQVLTDIPGAFRRGSIATTLGRAADEGQWREKICQSMAKAVGATTEDWKWIVSNFRMDLETIQYRTRYMTVLAGAVLYLIMQGIDTLVSNEPKVSQVMLPSLGWVDVTNDNSGEFVGLALFLILFYLSGSQTRHTLQRYLNCAELMVMEKEETVERQDVEADRV